MSTTALEHTQVPAVTTVDQEMIDRVLSNPLFFPQAFKTWLVKFLEGSDVTLTAGQVLPGPPAATPPSTIGTIYAFAGTTAPTNYFVCNGQALSRSAYSALYAICGSIYGAGDGSTTFNIPDLQGRVIAMQGTHSSVVSLGQNEGLPVSARTPRHFHKGDGAMHLYSPGFSSGGIQLPGVAGTGGSGDTFGGLINTGDTSGPQDSEAYMVLNYIIQAL